MNIQKTIIWHDRAMAFSFYALIYFLPISIALLESFAGLALFFYLFKRGTMFYVQIKKGSFSWQTLYFPKKIFAFLRAFKPVKNFLNWPIGILLFFILISAIVSQIPALSFRGYVGKTLQYVFLYFTFLECIHSRKRIKIFLTVYLISFALICINGIFQKFTGQDFIYGQPIDGMRIFSSLRHANDFGAYLILIIPVLFSLSILLGRRERTAVPGESSDFLVFTSLITRVIIFLLFILALICLGLTFSRGAWLAFALSLVFMGFRKLKFLLPCLLLVAAFLSISYPYLIEQRSALWGNQWNLKDLLSFTSSNRLLYWQGTAQIIKEYPLFGTGLNTYSLIVGNYKQQFGGYAHNCYLQMTAETGLFGLAAFLWMLFVLFRNSFKGLRLIEGRAYQLLLFGLLTGLLAFLIHGFFDTIFYSVQLSSLMWVIMGMIVTLQKIHEP